MRRPAILGFAALLAILGGSFLFAATWHLSWFRGLYCAVGTAATVGCDVNPSSTAGRVAVILVVVTAVPLLAAAFAELTGIHMAAWWHREHGKALADARRAAEAAHRIAADLFEHHTGRPHPDAPAPKEADG